MEESAIREDVQQQGGEAAPDNSKPDTKPDDYNPRAAAYAAIAKAHADKVADEVKRGGGPGATNPTDADAQIEAQLDDPDAPAVEAPAKELVAAPVIAKQVDDQSEIVLSPDDMKRVRIRTKVDGTETTVDGTKVLASYQKNEAADARLARATELERKAQATLDAAENRAKEAQTKAEAEAARKAVEDAKTARAGLASTLKQAQELLFEGKVDESTALWEKVLDSMTTIASANRGPTPEKLDEAAVVQRVAPVVRQQLEVEGALTKLYADYPQFRDDEDLALVADRARARLEAEGVSRPEAIARAGDATAKKLGFAKTADAPASKASTTQAEKLAAKKGLDEPASTSARATSLEKPARSASATIAEIAKSRGQLY